VLEGGGAVGDDDLPARTSALVSQRCHLTVQVVPGAKGPIQITECRGSLL
jgi:hypothetical protein